MITRIIENGTFSRKNNKTILTYKKIAKNSYKSEFLLKLNKLTSEKLRNFVENHLHIIDDCGIIKAVLTSWIIVQTTMEVKNDSR